MGELRGFLPRSFFTESSVDYLDGWAARKHDEISELGKVIDPIADKIMAGILFIFAVYLGKISALVPGGIAEP